MLAVVAMTLPFAGLGSTLVMVRNVAQTRGPIAKEWANALCAGVITGVALSSLLAVGCWTVSPGAVSAGALLAVAVSDLVCAKAVEQAGGVFVGTNSFARSAWYPNFLHAGRLLTLIILVAGPWRLTLDLWAVSYLLGAAPVAVATAGATTRKLGWDPPQLRAYFRELRTTGLLFSVGTSSQTMHNDADKVLLARLGSLQDAGIYAAAYRIVDMSYVPVRAMLAAASPAMWAAGPRGARATIDVVRRAIAKPVSLYCLLGACAMAVFADFAPLILGDEYESSTAVLRALAVLLILKGAHYVAADTLTVAGHQLARTVIQLAVASGNIGLCIVLVPMHGYWGAVIASLFSDGLLAVLLWCVLLHHLRREDADSRIATDATAA